MESDKDNNLEFQSFLRKKLFLVSLFLIVTPLTIIASAISLVSLHSPSKREVKGIATSYPTTTRMRLYAPLPNSEPTVLGRVESADARPEILRQYMTANNSPLAPHADFIVQVADEQSIDFRLITAIAQKESGLCRVIPENSHNCWGWGIHSQGTLGFDSYEEGVVTVSKGLKENYIDKGYITVEQIMEKYAHPESTTWADGVLFYMSQME